MRTEKGWTLKEMAQKVMISANTLLNYEKDQVSPSLDNAEKIAQTLGVSLDWLCGLSDNRGGTPRPTCGEAMRMFVSLQKLADVEIAEDVWIEDGNLHGNYTVMCTLNDVFGKFLSGWKKMAGLLLDGSIDSELFALWENKQIKDADNIAVNPSTIDYALGSPGVDDADLPF